jgi:hypothetical protein
MHGVARRWLQNGKCLSSVPGQRTGTVTTLTEYLRAGMNIGFLSSLHSKY